MTQTTTALQIINLAAKDAGILGVGQALSAEDIADYFRRLNNLVRQWNLKRWLIWHLRDLSLVSTGAQSYTIGPQGDFNISVRPDKLADGCFLRQLVDTGQPVDYPLEILQSYEDYNHLPLKNLTSFSYYVFLDTSWPLGRVYVYPISSSAIYEIHLLVKDVLEQFDTPSQVLALGDEYASGLEYELAIRMCAATGQAASDDLKGLARDALQTIRTSNYQIARLRMPAGLIRQGIYNIYTDQTR